VYDARGGFLNPPTASRSASHRPVLARSVIYAPKSLPVDLAPQAPLCSHLCIEAFGSPSRPSQALVHPSETPRFVTKHCWSRVRLSLTLVRYFHVLFVLKGLMNSLWFVPVSRLQYHAYPFPFGDFLFRQSPPPQHNFAKRSGSLKSRMV